MPRDDGDLNGWWRAGLTLAAPVVRTGFRLVVSGVEHIPRDAGIVAANHVSALDGVLLAIATGDEARRMTRFLVAAEFFAKRRFGWALRLYRQIPLHRGAGDAEALRAAIDTVSAGALAGIFPEGRVNPRPADGLQRGHTGIARIALEAGGSVVPTGIWGTQLRWPLPGLRLGPPLRPTVAIAYGPPIAPIGDAGSTDDIEAFTAVVMKAIGEQADLATALAAAHGAG